MKIREVKINNFRLLNSVNVKFGDSNYFVGKNNIGKTSMLHFMNTLFSRNSFGVNDFFDISKPINAKLTLEISNDEIGIFDDIFSPKDKNTIKLDILQESPDDDLYVCEEYTGNNIRNSKLHLANFIYYSSNVKPVGDRDITSQRGAYKLIPELVEKYAITNNKNKFTTPEEIDDVLFFINKIMNNLGTFGDANLNVAFEKNFQDFIMNSIVIKDNNGNLFNKLGYGIQFANIIILKIFDQIINWKNNRSLAKRIIIKEDGSKELKIILALDEPEIHLHPNMQLQIIKYVKNILNGTDEGFNYVLKKIFDIDCIKGQLFVVTHSPEIVTTNYQEICRFYTNKEKIHIKSGMDIVLDKTDSKQFERKFPNISKAFFADGVLIVEGDTEENSIVEFANKLNRNLVDNNINVVRADGVKSVAPLYELLEKLDIKVVGIIDKDNGNHKDILKNHPKIYSTKQADFEYECWEVMSLSDINNYVFNYNEIDSGMEDGTKKYLAFWIKHITRNKERYTSLLKEKKYEELYSEIETLITSDFNKDDIKEDIIKMLKQKSIINGKIIAESMTAIPEVYKNAIEVITNE